MTTFRRALGIVAVGACTVAARGAGAQVGYPTDRSPYADLDWKQALTLIGGYYHAAKDPAGVAPQSGPMVGMQYDLGTSGPVLFTSRVRSVLTERTVLDPARAQGQRVLGTQKRPLTLADVGLSLALTGPRTYRGIVPLVHLGAGVASDFAATDPGGFHLGTSFLFDYGLGVRIVPHGSRLSVRADVGSSLWRLRYPPAYATAGLDSTSVVPASSRLSHWRNNPSITAGLSYQFGRR